MVNSKRKGYINEHNLEKLLNSRGIRAVRIPLSGADKFQKGDILLEDFDLVCEVKVRKKLNSIFYETLKKNEVAFFRQNRKEYFVVSRLDFFLELLIILKQVKKDSKKSRKNS